MPSALANQTSSRFSWHKQARDEKAKIEETEIVR
jgi:hypothetical protein